MDITLADTAGFCFGVKRAVETVYKEVNEGKQVYTFGPIIHNDEVVNDLNKLGVQVIHSIDELKNLSGGTIIIRSHGVSKEIYDIMNQTDENGKKKFEIVDATCPFVLKIHKIVEEQSALGRKIIIIGDEKHPEVVGIKGWSHNGSIIIENVNDIDKICLSKGEKVCIVAQTTFNYKNFEELVEIISKKGYDILVLNTICNATEERQTEARKLAKESDAMIVIGGKQSSNTRKLYEISKKECENTYYIQTLSDLDLKLFKSFRSVGITAGASTPNNIIKEVHTTMSEMSFEQLLSEENLVTIHNGEVVEGKVISVKEDEIVLNIGYKSDGIITRNEYTNTPNVDLRTVVQEGDTMTAKVLKVNDGDGQVLLTYKRLAAEKGSKRLEEAFNNKEVLKAKVANVLDGGLSVIIDEARIFIPASLVSDSYEKNLEKYKDQEIEFVISEFNPKRRRVIGDRKQLLVAKKQELQKELFAKIKVGDVVEGTVKNVTDFGAFIDLGGADGLLHISEMSWGRVENPKKVFKVGETVKAFIKDIQGEKIALSLKFPEENPWVNAAEKYAVGNVVTGKVARMTDFGAFIELVPGVDALLHVSQISKEHIEKPADVLKVGQEITAKIVDFNNDERKISLSVKALEAPAVEEEVTSTEE
ncbi:bifunctional 4-hydroxy-3-methylbut-2-enyl diphosphate reductase/30S ribosomal protein S1 [Clostridium sp. Marseille-P299]|uniref:bifunctional 4-hydroxy-3-methylbut-2-enyl diphosphate reductase/30S ribosomal protein S1 n=1 Tax=Clostridium sp. Marseille-P299 TaxID=1805477 RepID=UPI000836AEFC|nr:bifunctional 4-hydroxy-3-methylbut-2-enyl diphosphate reductase/30S ribosomal protein S1 [Clostridium sp. Marseille-P299]